MTERLPRVVFMGTPAFAVPSLRGLASSGRCELVGVFTQPDRPAGRGGAMTFPAVKEEAMRLDVAVFQPERLSDAAAQQALESLRPDVVVVVAYGQILRQRALDVPPRGCVNVHGSLLPRWRGAAPIQRAVAAGDACTGVSIMRMERGLDTGPVYAMAATMIGDTETAGELHDRLAAMGASLLLEHFDAIAAGSAVAAVQPSTRATYATMLTAADRDADFARSALDVASHINGMSPWPGVTVRCGGETMALLRAKVSEVPAGDAAPSTVLRASPADGLVVACGERTSVEVLDVKRPGKRAMATSECLRGVTLPVGARLGQCA